MLKTMRLLGGLILVMSACATTQAQVSPQESIDPFADTETKATSLTLASDNASTSRSPSPSIPAEGILSEAKALVPPSSSSSEQQIIKTASLEIITSQVDDSFAKAINVARRIGGYTLSSNHQDQKSTVVLRVPSRRFEEAMQCLASLGKVERRMVTGTDVTAEFVDFSMRLSNVEQMRRRYLELLQDATKVSEAIQVQRELERIPQSIEQLRGHINLLQNKIRMSTIKLSFEAPTRPGPVGWIFYGLYQGVRWLFVWD